MINCTEINSAKPAPEKRRKPAGWLHLCGFRCAGCKRKFRSTQGSRFVMVGSYKRRVCGECAGDNAGNERTPLAGGPID